MKILERLRGRDKEAESVAEEMGEKLLEAKTKLKSGTLTTEKKRTNIEKDLEKLRTGGKEALRVGNQMGFKKAARRYGMLNDRANKLAALEDYMHSNLILIEDAEFLDWYQKTVEKNVIPALESLKLHDPKLETNLEKLRESREKLASKIDMMSEEIEVGMPTARTEDIETELKEELLAELSAEGEDVKEIEKKISERMSH